jgi:hypothetical protein
VSRGTAALTRAFSASAGDLVAREAGSNARVFADERYADWLMFQHPSLVGRLGYDASFEQLSAKQVLKIIKWKDVIGSEWDAATRGAKVVVLSLPTGKAVARAYRHDHALRQLYRDHRIAVYARR